MRIRFLREASDDLDAIYAYIAQDNPAAGARVSEELWRKIASSRDFPLRGRQGPLRGTRQLVASPYVIYYSADEAQDQIVIYAVTHGAPADE